MWGLAKREHEIKCPLKSHQADLLFSFISQKGANALHMPKHFLVMVGAGLVDLYMERGRLPMYVLPRVGLWRC